MDNTQQFPQLETERLILRKVTHDDAEAMFPHYSDKKVWKYVDTYPAKSLNDVIEVIDWGENLRINNWGLFWGLFSKEDSSFVGEINYVGRRDGTIEGKIRRCEIGYNVVRRYWGKGLASEALHVIIPHIFNTTEIHRIEAIIRPANTRSWKLVSRLGFKREGLLRDYIFWDGKYHDNYLYALLKREWQSSG